MKYLKLDYAYLPCKAKIYHKGEVINSWSVEDPLTLVNTVIDDMNVSGFEKIKMKSTVKTVTDIFSPKSIKIIEKE